MSLSETAFRIWKSRNQILEGIKNSIFKQDDIETVAKNRLAICQSNECGSYDTTGKGCAVPGTQPCCNMNNGGCGCSLTFATRTMSKPCPKGLWPAELTEEEETFLNKNLIDRQNEAVKSGT